MPQYYNAADHGIVTSPIDAPDDPGAAVANTAAINALVRTVGAAGGGTILYEPGRYQIAGSIWHTQHGVLHQGAGPGGFSNAFLAGDYWLRSGGTLWDQVGTNAGAMVELRTVPAMESTPEGLATPGGIPVQGGGITDIALDARGAAHGIRIMTARHTRLQRLAVIGPSQFGIALGVVPPGQLDSPTEPRDSQRLILDDVFVDCWSSPMATATCILIMGDSTPPDGPYRAANVSLCDWGSLQLLHRTGHGIRMDNCDSLVISSVQAHRMATTDAGSGILFNGSAYPTLFPRHNAIRWYQGPAPITVDMSKAVDPANNYAFLDGGNGTPVPRQRLADGTYAPLPSGPVLTWTRL